MNTYNKLWTKTAFAKVPAIGEQDGLGDEAVAHVKLFNPMTGERWYILEYNKETGQAFCLYTRFDGVSLGYSAINEVNPGDWEGEDMQSLNNKRRFPPFERDSSFKPTKVGTIKKKVGTLCPA